jgi:hypothetical protein
MLVPDAIDGVYHVVNRVVDRRMAIGPREKRHFLKLTKAYAAFSGIRLLAWCLMDNHFHLLLQVPAKSIAPPDEAEVLRRMAFIYPDAQMLEVRGQLAACKDDAAARAKLLAPYARRMGDLAQCMKTLQQRFTQWFNRIHTRTGTLWEDRFRSTIVEGVDESGRTSHATRIVAAYIDLNPLRAGIVDDPKDSPWCGYGAAVRGDKEARAGIEKLWGMQGAGAMAAHRVFLYEEGAAEKTEDGKTQDARTGEWKCRKGIGGADVRKEQKRGGRLPLHVMLRMRVRYMTAGGVIGSRAFVEEVTGASGESKPGTLMRRGDWGGLRSLRNLQRRVFGNT